jgi:hypothetical protein
VTDREIRVRKPFRVLAGLVWSGFLLMAVIDPPGMLEMVLDDLVSLAAFATVLPLFIYVTFNGRMPEALVRRLPDSLYDDLAKAETLFTRFDVRTVVAALVILLLALYSIMQDAG